MNVMAKKAKSKTFYGKGNKELAAVTKEELKESGFKSLRDYLNNQQGKTRRTAAKVASKPKPRPAPRIPAPTPRVPAPASKAKASAPASKRKTPAILKASSNADLSAPKIPKSKSRPRRGSSAPLSMRSLKGFESSSPLKKYADPYKDVGKGPRGQKGQAPVPTTEEKVAMAGLALSALGGPGTIAGKAAIKGATKFGKPFITNLIKKIKDLAPKQQKEVLQAANRASTKTKAQLQTSRILDAAKRTQSARKPRKADRVEPYIAKASKPLTKGQSSASRTMDAAKQSQRKEIDPGYTGGALKRGGQIKKYNKGGKVVKRKEGGQVMSGNDLVSSLYN